LAADATAAGLTAAAQALVDSTILLLSPQTFDDLAQTDLTVARVSIEGLRNSITTSVALVAENVLWPLRQRVARHLLDLAVRDGDKVVVPSTVQTIADATGTVREVVTRLLRELRNEGLIGRTQGTLTLLNLSAIHAVATGSARNDKL
jgi:CRP-like cAMP-binding protein